MFIFELLSFPGFSVGLGYRQWFPHKSFLQLHWLEMPVCTHTAVCVCVCARTCVCPFESAVPIYLSVMHTFSLSLSVTWAQFIVHWCLWKRTKSTCQNVKGSQLPLYPLMSHIYGGTHVLHCNKETESEHVLFNILLTYDTKYTIALILANCLKKRRRRSKLSIIFWNTPVFVAAVSCSTDPEKMHRICYSGIHIGLNTETHHFHDRFTKQHTGPDVGSQHITQAPDIGSPLIT